MLATMWCFLACSIVKLFATEFRWNGAQQPEQHTFQFSDTGQSVKMLLSDAPVFSLHSSVSKFQVYRIDRILDFSSFARLGLNLKSQLSRFDKEHLHQHDGFISDLNFHFEFFLQSGLSMAECTNLCVSLGANVLQKKSELKELLQLKPIFRGFYWTKHFQTVSGSASHPKYRLDFNSHQIFPSNNFSSLGHVKLFHYNKGAFEELPFQKIRARTFYWSGERRQYYTAEPYQLLSRISGNGQNFQIIIPLLHSSHRPPFLLATCACVRTLTLNLRNTYLAHSIAERARLQIKGKPQNMEMQRVKAVSPSSSLSTVPAILRDFHRPYQMNFRDYLMEQDVYPLQIHDSISLPTREVPNQSGNHSLTKRALSMASLGFTVLTKAIQYSTPYILDQGKNVMSKLADRIGGRLFSPTARFSNTSNATFQQTMQQQFPPITSSTNITLSADRILLQLHEIQPAVTSTAVPDVRHARRLQMAAVHLDLFWTHVIPLLPDLVAESLIPTLPFPLKQGSKILVHIRRSYSFFLIRFFFEVQRTDLSFTSIQTFSCPFKKVDGHLFSAQMTNDLIKLDFNHKNEDQTLLQRQCADAILAKTPSNVLPYCPISTFLPKVAIPIFSMQQGSLYLFPGPSKIKVDCFRTKTDIILLSEDFHVFFISHSCSWSVSFGDLHGDFAATTSLVARVPYREILSIQVPVLNSHHKNVQVWLYVLSAVIAVILGIILTTYILISYYKYKYSPRLTLTESGSVEISMKHLDVGAIQTEENPFLQDQGSLQNVYSPPTHSSKNDNDTADILLKPKLSAKPASRSIPV